MRISKLTSFPFVYSFVLNILNRVVIIARMYYFEIVMDLQKSCKNSRVPLYPSPTSLNVITSVSTVITSKK